MWLRVAECAEYFGENPRLEIIPKPLWPVPLALLEGFDLDVWTIQQDVDRCVMVRVANETFPYFIAPNSYGAGSV
jgi:hypothetical protein